jgi:hypothetical protein
VRALAPVQRHASRRQERRGNAACDQGESDPGDNAFSAHRCYFPPSELQIRTIVDRLLAEGIRDALTIAVNLDAAGLIDGERVTVKQVKQTLCDLGYAGLT